MLHASPNRKAAASDYKDWLKRARRVVQAIRRQQVPHEMIPHLQRFILEFGHYNANFTLDELEAINYPKSPTANMAHHTYLRSHQTWAAEILRTHFDSQHKIAADVKAYPIFLDSPALWDEISLFCHVIQAKELENDELDQATLQLLTQDKQAVNDVWILLPAEVDQVKENYKKSCERFKNIRKKYIVSKFVPVELQALFLNEKGRKLNADICRQLDRVLAVELDTVKKATSTKKKPEKSFADKSAKEKASWIGAVFGKLKAHRPDVLIHANINDQKSLLAYLSDKDHLVEIETIIAEIEELLLPNDNNQVAKNLVGMYGQAIDLWMKNRLNELSANYYFVIPHLEFQGLQTLLILGEAEAFDSEHWGLKAIINRLGYRATFSKTIEAILRLYPKLFIDAEQTQEFWHHLLKIRQIQDLPEDEVELIATLPAELERDVEDLPIDTKAWKKQVNKFANQTCEKHFFINKVILMDFLKRLLNAQHHPLYSILLPELRQAIVRFSQAVKSNTPMSTAQAAREAQTVGELIRVFLAATNDAAQLPRPMTSTINEETMRDYPVQQAVMGPYAMRSYLRVLLACLKQHGNTALKVAVTNQNYFESLMNLQNINRSRVTFIKLNNLVTSDIDADVIFTEIDPNNATEKRLFKQKLVTVIRRMDFGILKAKKLTIVIDSTLNSLDDFEMQDFLSYSKPHIESGALNVIVLQSLTKFYQLGFDECAGGLNVVVNNEIDWMEHNKCYRSFQSSEPCDVVTERFFNYFSSLRLPDHEIELAGQAIEIPVQKNEQLVSRYIWSIITNNNLLYGLLTDCFPAIGNECDKYLKLVPMNDFNLSYVALNTGGILTAVDSGFSLKITDLEKFNNDIRDYLLKPIAHRMGLPLTSRLSIGFQLSSVTVALDSLRFTVGNEAGTTVWQYANIIAFIAKFLTGMKDLKSLFECDDKNNYPQRIRAFTEAAGDFVYPSTRVVRNTLPEFNGICYGPFGSKEEPVYLARISNHVFVLTPHKTFQKDRTTVVRDGIVTSLMKMAADQIEYLFHGIAYVRKQGVDPAICKFWLHENGRRLNFTEQLTPVNPDALAFAFKEMIKRENVVKKAISSLFSFENRNNAPPTNSEFCHIIPDKLCLNDIGINLSIRGYSKELSAIEINHWGEKDPTICRYLNFCLILCVRFVFGLQVKVKGDVQTNDSMYQHFLIRSTDNEFLETVFYDAFTAIRLNRANLLEIKDNIDQLAQVRTNKKHLFYDKNAPAWNRYDSSYFNGPCELPDTEYLNKILYTFYKDVYLLLEKRRPGILSLPMEIYPVTSCQSVFFVGSQPRAHSADVVPNNDEFSINLDEGMRRLIEFK